MTHPNGSDDDCGHATRDACACSWALKADGWCVWCGCGCCTDATTSVSETGGTLHTIEQQ